MNDTPDPKNSKISNLNINEGTVLLVDDEHTIRESGKVLLERMSFTVLIAIDGIEALGMFEKQMPLITLVITDMIMPRMNGKELFYRIRKIDPTCKIILASRFSSGVHIDDLFAEGLTDFISKPFRFTELSNVIERIFKGQQKRKLNIT